MSFLASSLPNPTKKERQIFVAYPYRLYDTRDYRKVFVDLSKAFNVEFIFADEKITDLHILQKIRNYIKESKFSIFDISGWNANVTLELGIALGLPERAFISFNPEKTDISEVPSDLRGVDRIQYTLFSNYSDALTKLLAQEFPIQREHAMESQIDSMRKQVIELVKNSDGLKMIDISKVLGISVDLAKVIVRPMVGINLEMQGATRGARYYPLGSTLEEKA